jgi:hypothetical protein
VYTPQNVEPYELFLLSTIQFQAPKDNFICERFSENCVYMLNGENLFVFDFSFFEHFSLENFEQFKINFQLGLRDNIFARKLGSKSGLSNVVAVCPLDRENFFCFESKNTFPK